MFGKGSVYVLISKLSTEAENFCSSQTGYFQNHVTVDIKSLQGLHAAHRMLTADLNTGKICFSETFYYKSYFTLK
jgi:hypothetical protein